MMGVRRGLPLRNLLELAEGRSPASTELTHMGHAITQNNTNCDEAR